MGSDSSPRARQPCCRWLLVQGKLARRGLLVQPWDVQGRTKTARQPSSLSTWSNVQGCTTLQSEIREMQLQPVNSKFTTLARISVLALHRSIVGYLFLDSVGIWARVRSGCEIFAVRRFRGRSEDVGVWLGARPCIWVWLGARPGIGSGWVLGLVSGSGWVLGLVSGSSTERTRFTTLA